MLAESQMNEEQPVIDDTLVRRLIATQFPQWAELSVRPMTPGGWDNRIFRLGQHMLVRMPSAADYELQVEKEHRWLPRLVRSLPLPIPTPLAMGRPGEGYPWKWSVYGWIDGDTALATPTGIADLHSFATSLAQFLIALQCIDPTGGPSPGPHNFYRGGALATYDAETREAVAALKGRVDVDTATHVWEAALATAWPGPPVWVHGDVHAGNLLLKGGRLSAVLDFGQLGVGRPSLRPVDHLDAVRRRQPRNLPHGASARRRHMGTRPRLGPVESYDRGGRSHRGERGRSGALAARH